MEPRASIRNFRPCYLVCALLLLAITSCARDQLIFPRNPIELPADGRTHTVATITRRSGRPLKTISIESASPDVRFLQQTDHTLAVLVRAPVQPSDSRLHFTWRDRRYTLNVHYVPSDSDMFHDGLPDALHLHSAEDRTAFRSWFVALAEQEASLPDDKLPPEIDDCAALLRFAYRESLVQHDDRWLAAQPEPERFASLVSVAQYHYPDTPLGLNLFRIVPGPYTPGDGGAFAQFANAHALLAFNTYFISRNVHVALPGELLFFRQLEQNSQYHSMTVTGPHADWVIYHTGPIGKQKGEIRRVAIEDLIHHPDARWRPLPGNTNFLGVYRWNLLHDGD
jgi:uncharacterized protein YfaT (DUF1175 family)